MSKSLRWIWHHKGSAGERAKGLAVGVFSGCFPFFGLQTLLGISLASVIKGNHLLAAIGTWISNPFTYLPLYWMNYYVGSTLIGKQENFPNISNLDSQEVWSQSLSFIVRVILGSFIVGGIAGTLSGAIYYHILKKLSRSAK
ncbi:DUF2062 domain-containing protein [Prochlorococcus sp. MIT 1341]|uniref:DUF2062 domain-containing protein n=1 Tax=Prochlorococcus sp. MIT 1341 TaxID=3096221 RepID=UPI002A7665E4|nr:DUF2062 domain-containing protein [Prochlorococcus sp. MIT 1341]